VLEASMKRVTILGRNGEMDLVVASGTLQTSFGAVVVGPPCFALHQPSKSRRGGCLENSSIFYVHCMFMESKSTQPERWGMWELRRPEIAVRGSSAALFRRGYQNVPEIAPH
jgi:hypothetical protein